MDLLLLVPFTFPIWNCREVTTVVDQERRTSISEDMSPPVREKKRKSIKKHKKEKKRKKERDEKEETKRQKKKKRRESHHHGGSGDDGAGQPVEVSTAEDGTAPVNSNDKKRKIRVDGPVNASGESNDDTKVRPLVESSALDFVDAPPARAAAVTEEPSSASASGGWPQLARLFQWRLVPANDALDAPR